MSVPQVSRFGQLFRRMFSLKEAFDYSLESSLLPVAPIWWAAQPELYHTREEKLFGSRVVVPAVAAQFGTLTVSATAGSIVVVDRVLAWSTQAQEILPLIVLAAQGQATGSAFCLDGRDLVDSDLAQEVKGRRGLFLNAGSSVGLVTAPGAIDTWFLPANTPVIIPLRWVLLNDPRRKTVMTVFVQGGVVNSALQFGFSGYERIFDPQETLA